MAKSETKNIQELLLRFLFRIIQFEKNTSR